MDWRTAEAARRCAGAAVDLAGGAQPADVADILEREVHRLRTIGCARLEGEDCAEAMDLLVQRFAAHAGEVPQAIRA